MSQPQVFPFVVGCAKSGTTMLRAMLDSHPALSVPPESYFVATLAEHPRRFSPWDPTARHELIAYLADQRWFRRWGLSVAAMEAAFERHAPADLADAIRCVFALYAEQHGKSRYGDKTPAYVFAMPEIAAMLPEARFVHLVRDGRDVSLSLTSKKFAPDDVPRASLFWRQRVLAGRRSGAKLGPARYLEVRYEDLVDDPEAWMNEICRFVDLTFDPAMLRYHERSDEVLAGVMRRKQHANIARPPVKGLRDWRTQMASDDVVLVEALAGDLLHELGYEVASRAAPVRVRLSAARLRLAYGVRSASGSARELVGA